LLLIIPVHTCPIPACLLTGHTPKPHGTLAQPPPPALVARSSRQQEPASRSQQAPTPARPGPPCPPTMVLVRRQCRGNPPAAVAVAWVTARSRSRAGRGATAPAVVVVATCCRLSAVAGAGGNPASPLPASFIALLPATRPVPPLLPSSSFTLATFSFRSPASPPPPPPWSNRTFRCNRIDRVVPALLPRLALHRRPFEQPQPPPPRLSFCGPARNVNDQRQAGAFSLLLASPV
ncbi:hypothetical protein DFJ73DRAFT_892691, partial [Zopfochytrium polystomum]